MQFNWETIIFVINAVVALLVTLGGSAIWMKVKAVANALAESGDVTTAFRKALEDDKFSPEEVDLLVKEINEAKGAWKDVFAGKK